ncbi:MAG TPA: hypothetical protein VMZ30_07250 [Pyrinomonadaceae bacterium]|nr:hypothetical protein [Pyrinomonadaceae bacterium]
MKTKTTLLMTLASLLIACNIIWSPTATVKKFMAAAQKGDADAMTQLFSKKARQKTSPRSNRTISNSLKWLSAGVSWRDNIGWTVSRETSTSEGKRVSFVYKNDKATDALQVVSLSKLAA